MPKDCQLIHPPKTVASCIPACIVRDTRLKKLSETDRVNYFPATPLFTVTITWAGQLHIADKILTLAQLRERPSAPKVLFMPPQNKPQMSWSAGSIFATTIAFYPDAWQRLGGTLDGTPPKAIEPALRILETEHQDIRWQMFWQEMSNVWAKCGDSDQSTNWEGSDKIRDWTYHVMGKLAFTGTGRSLRSAQRRLLRLTGHNKQTLDFFTKIETLHDLITQEPNTPLGELAADAGFADQSHMGRALKRSTGFSPARLNQKIATEESFWCYRLLEERF